MLNEMDTFVRAVELKSISAAARALRLTASSASLRIMHLEEQLGVRLLNRTTRAVHPTEAGLRFYSYALEVLHAFDQAKESVAATGGELVGVLSVITPLAFGRRFVAPLLSRFRQAHPRLEVRLRLSDHDPDMTREVADLSIQPSPLPASDLVVRKLADCPQVVCAAPGYLAAHGEPQEPQDLLAHSCLLGRSYTRQRGVWTFLGESAAIRVQVSGRLEADDSGVLTNWALDGEGIILKPVWEVRDHLQSGRLRVVLDNFVPEPLTLNLLYPTKRMVPAKAQAFADFLVEQAGELLAVSGASEQTLAPRRVVRAA